jgi:hypothetical protein
MSGFGITIPAFYCERVKGALELGAGEEKIAGNRKK